MTEWISFKKTRPNKRKIKHVMTFEIIIDRKGRQLPFMDIVETKTIDYDENGAYCNLFDEGILTHWMPLPEVPHE